MMEQLETFFNVSQQTQLFLWSCILGAVLGVVYDFFRVLRLIKRHKASIVFIEDFIFIIISSIVLFVFSTEYVRGEIRFFIFLGSLLGFIVYILTVGNFVVNIIRKIVLFTHKVLNKIHTKILSPIFVLFVKIYQKTIAKTSKLVTTFIISKLKTKKALKETENMVYNNHKRIENLTQRGGTKNGSQKAKSKKPKKAFYNKA